MIDIKLASHRNRLSRTISYWHKENEILRQARRKLIINFIGMADLAGLAYGKDSKKMYGNLIQLAGVAHTIMLAYGRPAWETIPENPESEIFALRMRQFLNKWSELIALGGTIRKVASDSFFGFGITRTNYGILPPAARNATGLEVGPMAKRISFDDFLYDGSAKEIEDCAYFGDLFYVPTELARNFEPFLNYNADAARSLQEFNYNTQYTDARVQDTDTPRNRTATSMTRLLYLYCPHTNEEIFWPANDTDFGGVGDLPLLAQQYQGHYSGPFDICTHLAIPDNVLSVSQAESTIRWHTLFNELADLTAEQSKSSKYNPVFEMGADRDADSLKWVKDRDWAGVSNLNKIGHHVVPGPDQTVLAHMAAAMRLFKEFSFNLDDTLGLAPTAGTATQSSLIRQRSNARSDDMGQTLNRSVENIGRKLGALALKHPSLTLPSRMTIPGTSNISIDTSFGPESRYPRSQDIDHYNVKLIASSLQYKTPEQILAEIQGSIKRIAQVASIKAAGIPVDLEQYTELEAKYTGHPELRTIFLGVLPEQQAKKEQHEMNMMNPDKGQYTRTNVSEQSNDGQLFSGLAQGQDSLLEG